jgi:signal transduction histidine kinase/ligand-binding sensor domain-containing protein
MRNIIVLLLLHFFQPAVFSQQLYFNHLSVNNGLSQGVNNCILKDSRGYIWISSFDGLNRFDGIECKKYYAAAGTHKGIKGTLFLNILEDKSGNMWIGSNEGLNFYNREKDNFICYVIAGSNNADQFCSPFYIDNDNNIWVQSGKEIFVFDIKHKKFNQIKSNISGYNLIPKVLAASLYQPVKTIIATSNTAAAVFKGVISGTDIRWQKIDLPFNGIVINTLHLTVDACWIGAKDGLYHCRISNMADCKKIPMGTQDNISSLYSDITGTLWIGTTNNGLFKADRNGNILQQFAPNTDNSYSLSGSQVTYIYTDNNRNIWVALWGEGVDYTNLDRFHFDRHISKQEAVKAGSDNFIRSVITVGDEIWCATQSGGIIVLDANKKIKTVIKKGLPLSIEHLCADGNKVWAATFSGLFVIDAGTRNVRQVNTARSLQSNQISQQYNYVHRLQDGNLLLSSNGGLFKAIQSNGEIKNIVLLKGVASSDVYLTTYENNNGELFISKAFKGFGIYKLNSDSLQSIKQFPLQGTIKCFTNTDDSLLWMGSTVGLIKFNKTTSSVSNLYTTTDGLLNQYIYGVVQDGAYLWLSSNAGICRFKPADKSIKIFSTADGLQSNEYNTYSFCKTADNEILFGGVNGLNSFNPTTLQPFKRSLELVLSNVMIEDSFYRTNVNYDAVKKLETAYKQNTVAFQFTVIDYVNANAAHISYMLEGYDRGWVNAANKTFIRYANLPPGDYILKVKAFNSDGVVSDNIFELPVSILPGWWQTWWFNLLVAGAVVSAGILFARNYLQRKLKKQKVELEKELAVEQERIRMARELHDGLGSMLSGIKHSFTAIKNEAHLDNEEQQKFEYTIDKLDDSIKDLRAISHTMFSAELLAEGLEAAIKNYCNSVSVTSKLPIIFESIYQQPSSLSGEQAFHIFRVVQELIQNIIKHAGATEAIVQLSYNSGMLSVTVEDNGAGFDINKAKLQDGIGLKNIEGRVKMLDGKLDVQSYHGKGTSVFIEVPV